MNRILNNIDSLFFTVVLVEAVGFDESSKLLFLASSWDAYNFKALLENTKSFPNAYISSKISPAV